MLRTLTGRLLFRHPKYVVVFIFLAWILVHVLVINDILGSGSVQRWQPPGIGVNSINRFSIKKTVVSKQALGSVRQNNIENPIASETIVTKFPHKKAVASRQACIQTKLKLYPSQDFRRFFASVKKTKCPGHDWVKIEAGVFRITAYAKSKFGRNITCACIPLIRGMDDFNYYYGAVIKDIRDGSNVTTDVSKVTCSSGSDRYTNYHLSVPYIEAVHKRIQSVDLPKGALGMNVLMFGFDSVSRLTWQRKLPRSYAYMMKVLKFIVLEGYNIVGDATLAALLPILTGKPEEKLPEARRGYEGAQPVDGYPWIWKEFQRAGYATHFTEDTAYLVAFSMRMQGFRDQPTDHYNRHFYMELEGEKVGECLGSEYKHKVQLNSLKDFETVYRNERRFSIGFHTDLSHDNIKRLNLADDELREWLEALYRGGLLNNTMFLLMSDHGTRYQQLRETVQGKLEERNPFFSIRMPPWFQHKYPSAYNNILTNSKRLTTPYDIHETFHDILQFRNEPLGSVTKTGISLFSEIPTERTCAHAEIDPHWCNCLDWNDTNIESYEVKNAAKSFVDMVNNLTAPVRNHCHIVELDKVIEAKVLVPNNRLLKHHEIIYGTSGKNNDFFRLYQLVIHTKPGGGHFEVTVKRDIGSGTFTSEMTGVSRTNLYGHDPDCISNSFPHLMRFCYCRN